MDGGLEGWKAGVMERVQIDVHCFYTTRERVLSIAAHSGFRKTKTNVTPVKGQRGQWSADGVNQAIATRTTLYKTNNSLNIALMTKISIRGVRILPLSWPDPHPLATTRGSIHFNPRIIYQRMGIG